MWILASGHVVLRSAITAFETISSGGGWTVRARVGDQTYELAGSYTTREAAIEAAEAAALGTE